MTELLLVGGLPRSGTALVQYLLNKHPAVAISGEQHPSDEVLRIALETNPDLRYIGDKSPRYSLDWQRVRTAFPACRLVFTVRDLRATIASVMRQSWAPADTRSCVDDLVERWERIERCDDCYKIHLEDLEAYPVETLTGLLSYLELPTGNYPMRSAVDVVLYGSVNRSKS